MKRSGSTLGAWLAALAVAVLGACAGTAPVMPTASEEIAELAPTGTLRVAAFTGNPLTGSRDRKTGDVSGITVTLANSLAERIGVPVRVIEYTAVGKIVGGAGTGEWDITVLGIDPARRERCPCGEAMSRRSAAGSDTQ